MPEVTLDGLVKHARVYGLDNAGKTDRKGQVIPYSSWRNLQRDSLVEVGVRYLSKENFVALVEAVGYRHLAPEAAAWWDEKREEWADEANFFAETWGHHEKTCP